MGANHKGSPRVLDALAKCWDAEDTSSWTAATKTPAGASDEADMGLLGYDEGDNGAWVTRWPGINSAGSATIQFILQDSADGVTYAACLTTAAVAFDGTGVFDPATAEIPVPEFARRYTRVQVVVGTAALTGGALSMGYVRGPSGGSR